MMTAHRDGRAKLINPYKLFLFFSMPVVLLWIVNLSIPWLSSVWPSGIMPEALEKAYTQAQLARTGTFGDTFGAVNSLFSGLALAGVAVAIVFQRRELRHQEEQTVIANQQLSIATQQKKEADDERRRAERYASLTASLNAATSLAQAASQSIEFTMSASPPRGPFPKSVSGTKSKDRPEQISRPTISRNTVAERRFRVYTQIQNMILFEIQNFDQFYKENRDILSLKTKKEYFGNFIRGILPEWRQLLLERVALQNAGRQGYAPDDTFTPKDWVMKQAHDQLRIVWLEVTAFLSQDGVIDTQLFNYMKSNLLPFETMMAEFRNIDDEDDEAVRAVFGKALTVMAQFDVSGVPV